MVRCGSRQGAGRNEAAAILWQWCHGNGRAVRMCVVWVWTNDEVWISQERGRIEQRSGNYVAVRGTAPSSWKVGWQCVALHHRVGRWGGRVVRRGGSVSRRIGTFWRLRVGGVRGGGRAVDTAMGLRDLIVSGRRATDSARASVLGWWECRGQRL